MYGEHFGNSSGAVIFYPEQSVTAGNWSDQTIAGTENQPLVVPTKTKTGPLIIKSATLATSNSVNFPVGFCGVDYACTSGTECCNDGACRVNGTCDSTQDVVSDYAYYFATGPIPDIPRVIADCGSGNGIISPSPWEGYDGGKDVCINSVVTAVFSLPMDPLSFNEGTITVEKCSDDACTKGEKVPMAIGYPLVSDSPYGKNSLFTWGPQAGTFASNTQYRVTLKGGAGGVGSDKGIVLPQDYRWEFHTSDTQEACKVGSLSVSPAAYTAIAQGETIGYLAQPGVDTYQCVEIGRAHV